MYIIDKHKDYYDHYSYIYGMDKKVAFDRRGSNVITDEDIFNISIEYYSRSSKPTTSFILLEVGFTQYLIKLFDFVMMKDTNLTYNFKYCKMEVVRIFKDYKHYFEGSHISIREAHPEYKWNWRNRKSRKEYIYERFGTSFNDCIVRIEEDDNKIISLPILKNTQLTSLIEGEEIWKELQNFISSLNNDKERNSNVTDVEKIVNHGFDKKTSFRHPMK